jgi:hypothetical protein
MLGQNQRRTAALIEVRILPQIAEPQNIFTHVRSRIGPPIVTALASFRQRVDKDDREDDRDDLTSVPKS